MLHVPDGLLLLLHMHGTGMDPWDVANGSWSFEEKNNVPGYSICPCVMQRQEINGRHTDKQILKKRILEVKLDEVGEPRSTQQNPCKREEW